MDMASIETGRIYCVSVSKSFSSRRIYSFLLAGKVLIFVTRKDNCAELAKNLKENGFTRKETNDRNIFTHLFFLVGLIHGDMAQFDRTQVITDFKKRDMPILIATDVAGLLLNDPFVVLKRSFCMKSI